MINTDLVLSFCVMFGGKKRKSFELKVGLHHNKAEKETLQKQMSSKGWADL